MLDTIWAEKIWLTVKDAARFQRVSEQTIHRICKQTTNSNYKYKETIGGKKLVNLASLSYDAIMRYEKAGLTKEPNPYDTEDSVDFKKLYDASSPQTKKRCDWWTKAILESKDISGTKSLDRFVEWWKRNNKFKISVSRLYAVKKMFEDNGGDRSFLLKEKHKPQTTVKDMWYNDFIACYKVYKKTKMESRLYALNEALKRGDVKNEKEFPSYNAFYRLFKKNEKNGKNKKAKNNSQQ